MTLLHSVAVYVQLRRVKSLDFVEPSPIYVGGGSMPRYVNDRD